MFDLFSRKFETEIRVTIRVTVLWAGSRTARNFSGLRTVPLAHYPSPCSALPPHPGARARGLPRPSALLASRSPPWTSASWKRCATTPVPSSSSVRPSVAASPVVVPSDTPLRSRSVGGSGAVRIAEPRSTHSDVRLETRRLIPSFPIPRARRRPDSSPGGRQARGAPRDGAQVRRAQRHCHRRVHRVRHPGGEGPHPRAPPVPLPQARRPLPLRQGAPRRLRQGVRRVQVRRGVRPGRL